MFLARVAVGVVEHRTETDTSIVKPVKGCHSIRGPVGDGYFAYMVYDTAQAYPSYVVTYQQPAAAPAAT